MTDKEYTFLQALASIDTTNIDLRDSPQAWDLVEQFVQSIREENSDILTGS